MIVHLVLFSCMSGGPQCVVATQIHTHRKPVLSEDTQLLPHFLRVCRILRKVVHAWIPPPAATCASLIDIQHAYGSEAVQHVLIAGARVYKTIAFELSLSRGK